MKCTTTKPLPVDVMMKYTQYHEKVDLNSYKHLSEEEIVEKLQEKGEDHQKRTFVLAHRNAPLVFHALDDFQKTLEQGFLHDRCEMAKQEASLWIENELLDEGPDMMIMGGAGGKGNMIRYYVVLFPTGDAQKTQKLQQELNGYNQKNRYELESSELLDEGLIVTILIHMDYSVDEIIMEMIHKLEGKGYKLMQGYGALNTEYPNKEFVEETKKHLSHMENLKQNLLKTGKRLTQEESFREEERMVDLVYDLKPEYAELAMRCSEQGIEFVCEDFMLKEKTKKNDERSGGDEDLPF